MDPRARVARLVFLVGTGPRGFGGSAPEVGKRKRHLVERCNDQVGANADVEPWKDAIRGRKRRIEQQGLRLNEVVAGRGRPVLHTQGKGTIADGRWTKRSEGEREPVEDPEVRGDGREGCEERTARVLHQGERLPSPGRLRVVGVVRIDTFSLEGVLVQRKVAVEQNAGAALPRQPRDVVVYSGWVVCLRGKGRAAAEGRRAVVRKLEAARPAGPGRRKERAGNRRCHDRAAGDASANRSHAESFADAAIPWQRLRCDPQRRSRRGPAATPALVAGRGRSAVLRGRRLQRLTRSI
jgi:hypothetical protein